MDFAFTEEQEMFRNTVRDFLEKEVLPLIPEAEKTGKYPVHTLRKMGELGFLAIHYPKEYGGSEAPMVTQCMFAEDTGRVSICFTDTPSTVVGCGKSICRSATEEVKRRCMPGVVRGETQITPALAEPGGGSDLGSMKTTAVRDGDSYIINGQKTFIPFVEWADCAMVVATMDPSKRMAGLTQFLVPKDTPGYSVSTLRFMGLHFSGYGSIFLDNCRIPKENLIGEEGEYLAVAEFLGDERVRVAAAVVGSADACYEEALKYSRERVAFGRTIGKFQAISFRLVDMAAEVEAARWLAYWAASLWDRGQKAVKESTMAKLYATEMGLRVTESAMRILAGWGYIEGGVVERHFRDARGYLFGAGTPEIERIVIFREL
jgi:alkylation response protein AidB-like acyl-CoA dehydrogenase